MFSTDELITELEGVIERVLQDRNRLVSELNQLKNEKSELLSQLNHAVKDIKVLENKNKEMKVVSGLNGNVEHKRLMKHKLNSLIKEVDLCIAEVKKKSI